MRVRSCLAIALVCSLSGTTAAAQNQPASTVRTLLAAGSLGGLADRPFFFRLYRVLLSAAQRSSYNGANGMLYGLSGALEIDIAGTPSSLVEGGGTYIPAGRPATISASGAGPADFLIFELSPRPNQTAPLLDPDAVEELYRTPEPVPGLKPGPYEFSLTRVSLPPGMPANPPHYRSGAALYYILSGSGLFTVAGNTEPRTAGMPHFEPAGMVHQWANPADTPLVLIQANISQEGIPAVIAPGAK